MSKKLDPLHTGRREILNDKTQSATDRLKAFTYGRGYVVAGYEILNRVIDEARALGKPILDMNDLYVIMDQIGLELNSSQKELETHNSLYVKLIGETDPEMGPIVEAQYIVDKLRGISK